MHPRVAPTGSTLCPFMPVGGCIIFHIHIFYSFKINIYVFFLNNIVTNPTNNKVLLCTKFYKAAWRHSRCGGWTDNFVCTEQIYILHVQKYFYHFWKIVMFLVKSKIKNVINERHNLKILLWGRQIISFVVNRPTIGTNIKFLY